MATGDFTILEQASGQGGRGARLYNVSAGTPILAGEPVVQQVVSTAFVMPAINNAPGVSTTAGVEGTFVGIAATNSTNSLTGAGVVYVTPGVPTTTWIANGTQPANSNTQALYNGIVGKRVTINNSTTVGATPQNIGTYTINTSDGAANGATVQALFDITKYPNKIAIAFRMGSSNLL